MAGPGDSQLLDGPGGDAVGGPDGQEKQARRGGRDVPGRFGAGATVLAFYQARGEVLMEMKRYLDAVSSFALMVRDAPGSAVALQRLNSCW